MRDNMRHTIEIPQIYYWGEMRLRIKLNSNYRTDTIFIYVKNGLTQDDYRRVVQYEVALHGAKDKDSITRAVQNVQLSSKEGAVKVNNKKLHGW